MHNLEIRDLKFGNWIFVLILAVCFLSTASVVEATNPSDLEQQIEQVRKDRESLIEEQKKLQAELEKVNREGQTLGTAVKSLDTTRKKLAKDISITQSKITSTNLTIKSLENTMTDKERQIIVHRKAIATALQALSQYDSRGLVFDLLASSQFSDVWVDRSQLEGLSGRMEDEINALRETRKILTQEKAQKEQAKKEQLSLAGQLSGQKSVIEESQKAKEKLLTETKNKEAEYQKMLEENLRRQKEFEEDLYRLESGLQIAIDPTLVPSPRPGILSWPLTKVFITDTFGIRPTRYHNGVDFRASQGTPVMAMADGVVEGTANTDDQKGCYSYGRWIFIRYNNGLSSIYAHLSASVVKVGQSVKAGEIIGYSGGQPRVYGSGHSTGPHLHVGLFASQGVEIRSFSSKRYLTTGAGCHNIYIPLADIKAYLDPLLYLPTL
jgi:murein DD-endopeptidase MepM/ murein hydrolase activator NlpD